MNFSSCYARTVETILLRIIGSGPPCLFRQIRGHRTAAWNPKKLRLKDERPIAPVDLPAPNDQRYRGEEKVLKDASRDVDILDKNSEYASTQGGKLQRDKQPWQTQKEALRRKFKNQTWSPLKRLSPDALDGIRAMHSQFPDKFTTPVLAEHFKVSPEVIRRVLKSKWTPSEDEIESRRLRWERRGQKIWAERAEKGLKPPAKWRRMGIGKLNQDNGPRKEIAATTNASKPGIKVHSGITATKITDYDGRHTRENLRRGVSTPERKSLGERIV